MKKRGFFLIFLLLVVGCQKYAPSYSDNPKIIDNLIKINETIDDLTDKIQNDPDNKELKYNLGIAYFNQSLFEAKQKNVRPGNEPFLLENKNNSIGCLLVHGFTASPWELSFLADYLFERNITVYATLLAGHGTSEQDLQNTKWQQWYNDFEKGIDTLNLLVDNVYACSQSLGGSLGLYYAENNPVKGVIAIGPPIEFKDKRSKYVWLFKYFVPYQYRELKEDEKPYYYQRRPIYGVYEINKLIKIYKKDLSKITAPTLIIQSVNDVSVDPESADYIYKHVSSENKQIIWINTSQHVPITNEGKEEIFEEIYNFIQRIER